MPFCPKCRYEYLPEISVCPDCASDLVAELPEIAELGLDIEWVKMKPLPGIIYAKMVTDVLNQRHIPNYVQSLFGSGGLGVVSGGDFPGSDARIWVPQTYLEEAQRIQNEMFKEA